MEIAIRGYDDSSKDDEEDDDGDGEYGEDGKELESEECTENRLDGDDAYGEDGKELKSEECAGERVDAIKGMSIEMNVTEVGSLPTMCLPRSDDLTKEDKPEPAVLDTASDTSVGKGVEDEEFGSAFGIMSVYCDSDLHTWFAYVGMEEGDT